MKASWTVVPLAVGATVMFSIAAVMVFRRIAVERRTGSDSPPNLTIGVLALVGLLCLGVLGFMVSVTLRFRVDQIKSLQRQRASPEAIEHVRRRGRGDIFLTVSAYAGGAAFAVASAWHQRARDKRKAVRKRFSEQGIHPQ